MAEILIQNLNNTRVARAHLTRHVLDAILKEYIDWMHACGGKGRCTTCKMDVVEGMEYLSPRSNFEQKCLEQGKLGPQQRLACQCTALGTVKVKVPKENQFPHMQYID